MGSTYDTRRELGKTANLFLEKWPWPGIGGKTLEVIS
jgi:hypothetical protein